jgi:hypothetical protein
MVLAVIAVTFLRDVGRIAGGLGSFMSKKVLSASDDTEVRNLEFSNCIW